MLPLGLDIKKTIFFLQRWKRRQINTRFGPWQAFEAWSNVSELGVRLEEARSIWMALHSGWLHLYSEMLDKA